MRIRIKNSSLNFVKIPREIFSNNDLQSLIKECYINSPTILENLDNITSLKLWKGYSHQGGYVTGFDVTYTINGTATTSSNFRKFDTQEEALNTNNVFGKEYVASSAGGFYVVFNAEPFANANNGATFQTTIINNGASAKKLSANPTIKAYLESQE